MITKILTILLSNCRPEDSDSRNRVLQVLTNLLNLFTSVLMLLVFVVVALYRKGLDQCLCVLGVSLAFGLLFFLSRKYSLKAISAAGLAAALVSSICLLLLFPTYGVFSFFAMLVPLYALMCMEYHAALIATIVFVAIHGAIITLHTPVDLISAAVFASASILAFAIIAVAIAYCGILAEDGRKEAAALESDVKKKQEFISRLSHRIRTPLSSIFGIANILEDTVSPESRKQLIESLVASAKTITDIVEIIDDESAGGSGFSFGPDADSQAITTFDLQQLITQTGEFTQNFEVKLEVHGTLPLLKGNAVKVRRIFLNIFDFFLQHTPKDQLPANVTIAVNRVRIPINPVKYRFDIKSGIVVDDFSESDVPELKIAKRLIENLNGNIKRRIEDDLTCIYFNICFDGEEELPVAALSQCDKVTTNETTGYSESVKPKDLSEVNVMVCDDNPINQKVLSLSLEKYVKSITLASNGQECVDLVAKSRFDIVLIDIQMPVLDGYAATRKIRNSEAQSGKHIPIIAVTANALAGDKQHCLSVGMDDYVSKPFHLDDVLSKMRCLISKYPQKI